MDHDGQQINHRKACNDAKMRTQLKHIETPADPWGVKQHHYNTRAKKKKKQNKKKKKKKTKKKKTTNNRAPVGRGADKKKSGPDYLNE